MKKLLFLSLCFIFIQKPHIQAQIFSSGQKTTSTLTLKFDEQTNDPTTNTVLGTEVELQGVNSPFEPKSIKFAKLLPISNSLVSPDDSNIISARINQNGDDDHNSDDNNTDDDNDDSPNGNSNDDDIRGNDNISLNDEPYVLGTEMELPGGLVSNVPNLRQSSLEPINQSNQNPLSVFPNPVQGETLFCKYETAQEGTVNIRIADACGRVILAKEQEVIQGVNTFKIGINTLPKGVCFITINHYGKTTNQRFVVIK